MKRKFFEVLTIINGKNQREVEDSNGEYPIYGSGGIIGYANKFLCPGNTVIIGRKGNINKPIYVDKPFWNVDTAFGLQADEKILLPKYLFYFCQRYNFEQHNKTVTIPSLTKADLLEIVIDVPEIDVQKRICKELDLIDSVICNRVVTLSTLDVLIKSRFVEMFGEYMDTKHQKKLKEVCDFIDYRGKTPEKAESGIPLITAKNVRENHFSEEPREYIPAENYEAVMTRGIPKVNDVLFTTEAPLGNVCRIPNTYDKFCVGQRIVTIQPHDDKLISEYLERVLLSNDFQNKVWRQATGSTVKGIRSKRLIELTIPVPPLDIQKQFADFVAFTDKSKLAVQQSIETLQTLKAKLMQDYFG